MAEEERFGFSAINASRCLCSALRARAAEKHGAQKGNDRGGLLRFARKAARCLPFRAFTGCPKLPLATGRQPFESLPMTAKKQTPMGSVFLAEEERFGFDPVASICLSSGLHKSGRDQNTGSPKAQHRCPLGGLRISSDDSKQNGHRMVSILFGGGGEIRTLERLMTVTRFPIVRPRPN